MEYEVLKDFKGSPNGYDIYEYKAGTKVELTDDLAKTAIAEKWVKNPKAKNSDAAEKKKEIDKLNKAIQALETNLGNASEADKPTIQTQIDAKKAELEELNKE